MDLFTPVVDEAQFHQNFRKTLDPTSTSVRRVLEEWANGFTDRDGKFVKEFQTTYNSCFWELYLFAVMKHLGIKVDFSVPAADFVSSNYPIAIEAAIASHAQGDVPEWSKTLAGVTHENLEGAYAQSIARLSNAFMGKSRAYDEKYAALPCMRERAYVVAISNFGTQDFHLLGDVAAQRLFYDVREERSVLKENGSPIPVGLFRSDKFAHVSAVLYSSVATFGKARALSDDDGAFIFRAVRIKDNYFPIEIVAQKKDYNESLTDGMRLFTNPYAAVPLDHEIFGDFGIRRFIADKDGDFDVSCHADGDLCMRTVTQLVPKRK